MTTALKRQMIRRTIKEHLDKEMRLRPQGIKVLSLFFIDVVEHYRSYDADGKPSEGQVRADVRGGVPPRCAKHPDYQTLVQGGGLAVRRRRRSTTATSRIDKKGALDGHRREQPGQPRQRRARLQPDHEGQGEAAELRDAS